MLQKLVTFMILFFIPEIGLPQWSGDPSQNLQVLHYCTNPWIVGDNDGGAIIVGVTFTVNPILYAQRVNTYGNIVWDPTIKGIRVSTAGDEQSIPVVVPDGAGGAYIGFHEMIIVGRYQEPPENKYFNRIRIQRIDSIGNQVFGPEGLSVYYYPVDSTEGHGQFIYKMISDNQRGIYILWYDYSGPEGAAFYLNHINHDGSLSWQNSLAIQLSHSYIEREFIIYNDGKDKVILLILRYFCDSRESPPRWQPQLLKIDRQGNIIMDKMLDFELSPFCLHSVTDAECILFWQDFNQAWNPDTIRCQKIDHNGEILWGQKPVIIDCTGIVANKFFIGITSNQKGGAYLAYEKGEKTAQLLHFNSDGEILFKKLIKNFNGIRFSGQSCMVGYPDKVVYSTYKFRSTDVFEDSYAYAVDSVGNEIWSNVLYTSRNQENMNDAVISDGNGGAIFAWYEMLPLRGTWIQQVNQDGQLGILTGLNENRHDKMEPESFQLFPAYPNPGQDTIYLPYQLNQNQPVMLKIYNIIGKEVRKYELQNQNSGLQRIVWNGCDQNSQPVANGVYFYRISTPRKQQISKLILLR